MEQLSLKRGNLSSGFHLIVRGRGANSCRRSLVEGNHAMIFVVGGKYVIMVARGDGEGGDHTRGGSEGGDHARGQDG